MRIGIDGGCWSNRRGYGRFARELIAAVIRRDTTNEYVLLLEPGGEDAFPVPEGLTIRRVATSSPVAETARADGRRALSDLWRMARAAAEERLDALFFPSVYSYFPPPPGMPAIVCFHDTIAERHPDLTFSSAKHALFWRVKVWAAALRADIVLTVSEYSRRCLHEYFRLPLGRIRVVSEGAAAVFRRIETEPPPRRFVLYAGGISPNKNLGTLVAAYARLRSRRHGLQLVLVGDYKSDRFKSCYAELQAQIEAAGMSGEVAFAGYIPDEELCRLYNMAAVFVMPSLDEGFGLPALEAMSCGAPVIVSSGSALEEVVGDAGLVVAPHDVAGLAEAMDRVLEDPALAQALSERSLRRAKVFSWERAAEQFLESLEAALARPRVRATARP